MKTLSSRFVKKIKKNQGFTLVELMVVVAIIGILSAVAIPNFKRYQAKSKNAEAKLQLAAIYTAESSFMSDFDTFGTCLGEMGYAPRVKDNYYTVGFVSDSSNANDNADSNGASNCGDNTTIAAAAASGDTVDIRAWNADKLVGNSRTDDSDLPGTTTIPGQGHTFQAGAAGIISADHVADFSIWTIDQDKVLDETQSGF